MSSIRIKKINGETRKDVFDWASAAITLADQNIEEGNRLDSVSLIMLDIFRALKILAKEDEI